MEKTANDALSLWREEGNRLIPKNFEDFRNLLAQSTEYARQGKYNAAAVYAEIAAFYANGMHGGFFVSQELENLLLTIGQKAIRQDFYPHQKSTSLSKKPQHILHVITSVGSVGGHTRMLWRWIQQDANRSHSIVITRQEQYTEVPTVLKTAVQNRGGKIYVLNDTIGNIISWAKQLRKIANQADLVVLYIHNYDVIPMIAFAQKEQSPPIIFLDHADHKFWLGVSISDLFVSLRETGMRLLHKRRGIEPEHSLLLPIIIEPTQRLLSRAEAKQKLGLPEDSILLLSVARAVKYKTIDGISFADAHTPLLKRNKKVFLLIVGPGYREDWVAAIQEVEGRIRVIEETPNTAIFYQAADIYVDSFPFVSNTSLLEAGSYAVPLVTRYPYSDASEILGADMPGLTGNLIRTRDIEEYIAVLSRLVEDKEFRRSLGEATRKKIAETHLGDNWQQILEDLYERAVIVPKVNKTTTAIDQMFMGEPDVFLPTVHGANFNSDSLISFYMRNMPFDLRWYHWQRLGKIHACRYPWSYLLPEWLYIRCSRFRLSLKKIFNHLYKSQ
jgi:glycosyltransferase involved in cell wall biosynthesis